MAKPGDIVRYLNTTGGGKITRIDGKIAFVEEDGFETPVLLKDLVVVQPAGSKPAMDGARLMFDQQAFDMGREEPIEPKEYIVANEEPSPELPVLETPGGNNLNLALAFEPTDIKNLDKSAFDAVLVNDSNYFINFIVLRKGSLDTAWSMVYSGVVAPNELIDITRIKRDELAEYETIAVQFFAYKKDKVFDIQKPGNIVRKIELTKFHKFHCFRPGLYFETPVLEYMLVKDGTFIGNRGAEDYDDNIMSGADKQSLQDLSNKFKADTGKKPQPKKNKDNPRKLLPLIEIDLHIGELTDTTAGMEPKDMLELQLDTVRKNMKSNSQRIGQKIVFIHGKGEGVLRKAVLDLLKKEYPKAEIQDASFREYGFGATLVTIH